MDCSICLEEITEQNRDYLVKFCCNQNYHFHCIKKWTDSKYTCPICRRLLDRKVLNILKNIQNNINELKLREERAHHIIETLMLDIKNVQERTKYNLEKISNINSYTNPHVEIPSSPILNNNNPLTFSRLLQRRGAIVLPLIIPDDDSSSPNRNQVGDCAYPAFCRCFSCFH